MAEQPALCEQIDQGLGRYFQLNGNNDYFGNDGNGLFKDFAESNGMDDDDAIRNDLALNDPNECLLMDAFDELDAFPGLPKDMSDDEKSVQIMKIIQKCAKEPNAYANDPYKPLKIEKNDFNVDEKERKRVTEFYKKECQSMFEENANAMGKDHVFMKMIAVGHRLNQPYLQYLVDMYDRDRVALANQDENNDASSYDVPVWAKKNPHMKQLAKMDKKHAEDVRAAIKSYHHRIAPKLIFRPVNLVQDSLAHVCYHICSTVLFVHELAAYKLKTNMGMKPSNNQTCPFQYDAVFALNGVTRGGNGIIQNDPNDEDDEDEEDEDKNDQKYFDCIGNIKMKLKDNDRLFVTETFDPSKEPDDSARILNETFEALKKKMHKKYNDKSKTQFYPRTHRFCAVIDRRRPPEEQVNNNKDDEKENENEIIELDELIMYEPEKGTDNFPNKQPVPMFYFNTSRKSIIPGYDVNGVGDERAKLIRQTIAAQDPCKGGIMTLSFHVESADVIRCYLFINGQSIRFMPEDIVLVLPRFFDKEYADNKLWDAEHEDAQRYIKEMNEALKDVHFNAFLKKNRTFPAPKL